MHLLILGANSDIAYAAAKVFAQKEHSHLYLASRDMDLLQKRADDIQIRYQVDARALYFDALDYASHQAFYNGLSPKPDGILVAFGYYGSSDARQLSFEESKRIIDTNYIGAVSILDIIAEDFKNRRHGFMMGISSVAGQRGRKKNFHYGSAKAAFTVYLSGLRNRLAGHHIPVHTVLPGFVRTKMTQGLSLPPALTASPERVAHDIYRAYTTGKAIVYTPWYWRWMMLIIQHIPETLFKRMNL